MNALYLAAGLLAAALLAYLAVALLMPEKF